MRVQKTTVMLLLAVCIPVIADSPWPRHSIDTTSRGADGVRLSDFNADGLPDIVTGWEEGGIIRVYLHPGVDKVRRPWPAVTVGKARSPEDAVAVDLDQDGTLDVVSCHEGKEKTVWVHWGPNRGSDAEQSRLLDAEAWTSEQIPSTAGLQRWMFALPMQVDDAGGIDLVVGSKNDGMVGWLESPKEPRNLSDWRLHEIVPAGWVMSLLAADVNGDGDEDIIVTDRKGGRRGLYWIQRRRDPKTGNVSWQRHDIGASDREPMFATVLNPATGPLEIWVATHNNEIVQYTANGNTPDDPKPWRLNRFTNPFDVGFGKAVAVARLDDNRRVIAHTTEAGAFKVGHKVPAVANAILHRQAAQWRIGPWEDVSGLEGVKFDLIRWVDMDQDGDLDLLTCEERDNLGVFWYERR